MADEWLSTPSGSAAEVVAAGALEMAGCDFQPGVTSGSATSDRIQAAFDVVWYQVLTEYERTVMCAGMYTDPQFTGEQVSIGSSGTVSTQEAIDLLWTVC